MEILIWLQSDSCIFSHQYIHLSAVGILRKRLIRVNLLTCSRPRDLIDLIGSLHLEKAQIESYLLSLKDKRYWSSVETSVNAFEYLVLSGRDLANNLELLISLAESILTPV